MSFSWLRTIAGLACVPTSRPFPTLPGVAKRRRRLLKRRRRRLLKRRRRLLKRRLLKRRRRLLKRRLLKRRRITTALEPKSPRKNPTSLMR